MDEFLFGEFVTSLEDEEGWDALNKLILVEAQKKVEVGNKGYYNWYPQEEKRMQLVLETSREENKINLEQFMFHHTSSAVWRLKIIHALDHYPNTYMASKEDESGGVIIRLVNEAVLDKKLEEGDIIEAQISAFAINGKVFKDDEAYEDSVPEDEEGHKHLLEDGALIPLYFILNNNSNLSDEGREQRDHIKDSILAFKGTMNTAAIININMFDTDFPPYCYTTINTNYGELPIFFTRELLDKNIKWMGEGNVIAGELFLSGDVCINEYDKYARDNDLEIKSDSE